MCAVLRSGRLRPDSVRRYRLEMGWTAPVAGNRARHARLANRARIHPRYGDDDRIVTSAPPNRLAQQCFSAGGECGCPSAVAGWTRRYERHSTQRPEVRAGERSTPFFTAWISARHIRYPDNYTSSISGYPNAAFSRSVTPRSRTSTPPNMRCHRHRRSDHKQEGKIHDHTAHPCRQVPGLDVTWSSTAVPDGGHRLRPGYHPAPVRHARPQVTSPLRHRPGPRRDTGRGRGAQQSRPDALSDVPRTWVRAAGQKW